MALETSKLGSGGGRWQVCKEKSGLAGRRGPVQLRAQIGVGSSQHKSLAMT